MRGGVATIVLLLVAAGTTWPAAAAERNHAREARNAARRGDAGAILQATRDVHRTMPSLESEGETTLRMTMLGSEHSTVLRFSIRLARPNRYRISWTGSGAEGPMPSGAVWNAGGGPYNYMSPPGSYAAAPTDEAALAMATGMSQGLAYDVATLFFEGKGRLADLQATTLDGIEVVEGEPCWKISGTSPVAERVSVWIATKRLVVRKVEHSLASPPEGPAGAEARLDDAQLDEALRSAGGEPTPERRAQIKAIMEMAKVAAKHAGAVNGTVTHTQRQVRLDGRFGDDDFEFAVPPGTPLRKSLLDATLGLEPAKQAVEPEHRPGDGARGRALLDRVVARYRALRSYASDGEIVRRVGPLETDVTDTSEFALTFVRPDRYRIVWWRGRREGSDGAEGAVWDAGEGPFAYGRSHGAYTRHRDSQSAFAIAAGVSKGITRGLPALFFQGDGWLIELDDPVLEGTDIVDGEPCGVISGASRGSAKHTLWIGRDLLVRRHRRLHQKRPDDARDERQSLEYAAEEMKRTATPEAKAMVDMMADMQKLAVALPMTSPGDTTETYRNIRVDVSVERSDVAFDVPPGTPLKASLTEGMFRTQPVAPK